MARDDSRTITSLCSASRNNAEATRLVETLASTRSARTNANCHVPRIPNDFERSATAYVPRSRDRAGIVRSFVGAVRRGTKLEIDFRGFQRFKGTTD